MRQVSKCLLALLTLSVLRSLRRNYSISLKDLGEVSRAIRLPEEVVAARTAQIGPGHRNTLAAQLKLGNALAESGDVGAACPLLETAAK